MAEKILVNDGYKPETITEGYQPSYVTKGYQPTKTDYNPQSGYQPEQGVGTNNPSNIPTPPPKEE